MTRSVVIVGRCKYVFYVLPEKQCGLDVACPPDKIAYWLRSGQGVNGQATICFDGI